MSPASLLHPSKQLALAWCSHWPLGQSCSCCGTGRSLAQPSSPSISSGPCAPYSHCGDPHLAAHLPSPHPLLQYRTRRSVQDAGAGCPCRTGTGGHVPFQPPPGDGGGCLPWVAVAQKRATGCDTRPHQCLPLPPTFLPRLPCMSGRNKTIRSTRASLAWAPASPGSTFGFIIVHLILLFMDDQAPILRHLEVMAHSSGPLWAWLGGCSQRGRSGEGPTLGAVIPPEPLCIARAPALSTPSQPHLKLCSSPSTRWDTLGSRKLRGSSSSPSFSQAWPFCRACFLHSLLRCRSSSSSSSSSESARISSKLVKIQKQ